MKITDKALCEWFGISCPTLRRWKSGDLANQRRYHALKEYYEAHHPHWRIDYDAMIADHGDLKVKVIQTDEELAQNIDGVVVSAGFDKPDGRHYALKILEIDKPIWAEIRKNPSTLSRLARELGDLWQ